MQPTRQLILDYLRSHGEATVRELGDYLELTATGPRQHLTHPRPAAPRPRPAKRGPVRPPPPRSRPAGG